MGYYIDLEKISIEAYRDKLKTAYLPPSRRILKENANERFDQFNQIGIENVSELLTLLKKSEKIDELQKIDCLSGDYLKLLLRELKSTLPKPNRIREFPGISPKTYQALEKIKIKNTANLYPNVLNDESRKELAIHTGISESEIMELTKLTDLSRIKWVGTTFARMLYDMGYDTLLKIKKANPQKLHQEINQFNKENNIYRGHIGLNDVRIFIDVACDLPIDIEY